MTTNQNISIKKERMYGMPRLTLEMIEKIIDGYKQAVPSEKIAKEVGKSVARIEYLWSYYNKWNKTGVIWAGHIRVAEIFEEYNKKHNLPLPPKHILSNNPLVLSSEVDLLKNPYIEFEVMVKKFTQEITNLAREIAKQEVNRELKKFIGQFQEKLDKPRRRRI